MLVRCAPTPLAAVQLTPDDPVVWCKLDYLNPSGSTKDRIARFILEKAWREGRLFRGDTVVEASSGSTSIAMALAAAQMGLRFVACMPEGVSNERVMIIRAYGGEIRLTPKAAGIRGAIAETERWAAADPRAFLPRQFSNPDNALAHQTGTAREILDQIPSGNVDAIASGVGTGGTLVGLYRGLTESGCSVTPIFARPVQVTREMDIECCSFSPCIPGVVDAISTIFTAETLPGVRTTEIRDDDAIAATRQLIAAGFPVGPSSGLNFLAARCFARENPAVSVVTVFCDRMERYFTTELFTPYR